MTLSRDMSNGVLDYSMYEWEEIWTLYINLASSSFLSLHGNK
jgi:hypothetical protein